MKDVAPQVTRRVKQEITQGADDILEEMVSLVPKRTGSLANALTAKVSRDGLTARVGLLSRAAFRDHFYWLYVENGTKGAAELNIPPQPAQPFMRPAFDFHAPIIYERLSRATLGALRLSGGIKGKRK